MSFDLKEHSARFYFSLCTCAYPIPSKLDKGRCSECGGIITNMMPRYGALAEDKALAWTQVAMLIGMLIIILIALIAGIK